MGNVPDSVKKKIKSLSKKHDKDPRELIKNYKDIWDEPIVQDDSQFDSDEERHEYCIRRLQIETASGPSAEEEVVIPIGYTETQASSSGDDMCRIFMWLPEKEEKSTLVCKGKGNQAELWKQVDLFNKYNVRISSGDGVYFSDETTEFGSPKPIEHNPVNFLEGVVGVEKITIAETPKKPSQLQEGTEYLDQLDLRMIEGMVLSHNSGKRSDGSEYAVYTLGDESISEESGTTEDGKVIPKQFTVWVPPSMLKYGKGSEIIVVGSVTRAKEPQMNSYCVIPKRAVPIEEDKEED